MEIDSKQGHMIPIDVWSHKHELRKLVVFAEASKKSAREAGRSTEQGWKDFEKKCEDLYMEDDCKSHQYNEIRRISLILECLCLIVSDLKLGAEY